MTLFLAGFVSGSVVVAVLMHRLQARSAIESFMNQIAGLLLPCDTQAKTVAEARKRVCRYLVQTGHGRVFMAVETGKCLNGPEKEIAGRKAIINEIILQGSLKDQQENEHE